MKNRLLSAQKYYENYFDQRNDYFVTFSIDPSMYTTKHVTVSLFHPNETLPNLLSFRIFIHTNSLIRLFVSFSRFISYEFVKYTIH